MTVAFPLPLEVEQVNEGEWRVLNGFDAIVEEEGHETVVIHVPHGYLTDFASVPRIPFAYLLFGGKGSRAAVIHDYLYEGCDPELARRPRNWCDAVFHHGLLTIAEEEASKPHPGLTEVQADAMYDGVRVGGASHFHTPPDA